MTKNQPRREPATKHEHPADTPTGVGGGGGGETGPSPGLRDKVVSGDRNTGEPAAKKPKEKRQ